MKAMSRQSRKEHRIAVRERYKNKFLWSEKGAAPSILESTGESPLQKQRRKLALQATKFVVVNYTARVN